MPPLVGVRLQILGELVGRALPVDIASMTARVGGHPNTVRGHLDVLTEAGLAARESLPPAGRGRPALGYAATPAGRTAYLMCRAGGPVGTDDVAEALVSYLAARRDGPVLAREFGRHWGAGLAANAPSPGMATSADASDRDSADSADSAVDADNSDNADNSDSAADEASRTDVADGADSDSVVRRVTETLAWMGFSPEVTTPAALHVAREPSSSDGDVDADMSPAAEGQVTRIRLVTCPLLEAARQQPAVVCGIHQGLVEGLTDQRYRLTLAPFAEPGACVVTLSA